MRELSFKGYIKSYVRELSFSGSDSINKCSKELHENPRLVEPLVIHCILTGIPKGIDRRFPALYSECEKIRSLASSEKDFLKTELPYKYRKVVNSYFAKLEDKTLDTELKLLMCDKIINLQNKKIISTYRLAKDLSINNSNLNFFIKNKDTHKLSLSDVERIYNYLQNIK